MRGTTPEDSPGGRPREPDRGDVRVWGRYVCCVTNVLAENTTQPGSPTPSADYRWRAIRYL
eukprot:355039-Chlamydomonas_euryale.AAC.6